MTAILGRMASYSGKNIRWDDAINSEIVLADVDSLASMADPAPLEPGTDGQYAIPTPGKTITV